MESPNNLETNGSLQTNPPAELLAEISQAKFNGSLRLSSEQEKIAVYFDAGDVVYAVSNARQHRLFELLLQAGKITKEQLVAIPNFTNDLELKDYLLKNNLLPAFEINDFLSRQLSQILKTALHWSKGSWQFSPLVRVRSDIRFSINLPNLLIEHARHLPLSETSEKFVNSQELIYAKPVFPASLILSPHESFVYSRFEGGRYTLEQIQNLSGLPETETEKIIYTLWLGGLLIRENWSAAFSEKKIAAILSARLALKKGEQASVSSVSQPVNMGNFTPPATEITESATEIPAPTDKPVAEEKAVETPISLDEFIERVEQAKNFYEIFGLAPNAAAPEIKQTYFSLAKRFHPDLFHRETDAKLLQKVQRSFTKLAQAYDTLKTESSREVYDFRMRKELAEIKNTSQTATVDEIDQQKTANQAVENFERGFNLLMDGDYEAAVPFMARAVYLDKDNARYHAYYGKALSADKKARHQAESELQTAIKLESDNSDYRIMLAEFFMQFNLFKRAEGELKRLLAIFPSNSEAKRLLDSLSKK